MVHSGELAYLLWQSKDQQLAKPRGWGMASLCNVANHLQQGAGPIIVLTGKLLGTEGTIMAVKNNLKFLISISLIKFYQA